jgi:hypothetical protein
MFWSGREAPWIPRVERGGRVGDGEGR